ncbi:MAG: hypothetical protein KJZ83_02540 [Burkholderiaceae bacterium]|nr:hypothetical protein [Burkholderiaceae bacterium]
MRATLLFRSRVVYSGHAFAELVLWRLPRALDGSDHPYKYRLAYVVRGACVIRFDNEAGKGDQLHFSHGESKYRFVSPERLINDFQRQIERWTHENSDT